MTENENLGQDVAQAAPAEKMIPQSEVNALVGRIRQEAHNKGFQEARAEVSQQPAQQFNGLTKEDINQMIIEQTKASQLQQAREIRAQQIVDDFRNKMVAGIEKYPDFKEKVEALDLPKIPEIVHLAGSADNTADIMYELANNPHKIASLLTLARQAPHLSHIEMQKLSSSIKSNQKAAESIQPKEPLSQIKPSSAPSDKGPMTVADFRRAKWAQR